MLLDLGRKNKATNYDGMSNSLSKVKTNQRAAVTLLIFSLLGEMTARLLSVGHDHTNAERFFGFQQVSSDIIKF